MLKFIFYGDDGKTITTVPMKDDLRGCQYWEVKNKTVAIRLGREKTIRILPEARKL
jgi:hypothetical protein